MKRVLVVDDNPMIIEALYEELYEAYGTKITAAFSAEEAVSILSAESFELIICDYELPEGSGVMVYRYCQEKKHSLQFIFFTGLDFSHEIYFTGAHVVYQKKFSQLLQKISEMKILLP